MKEKKLVNCIKNQYFSMIRKKNYWIAFYLFLLYTSMVYILNLLSCMGLDKSSIYSSANYFVGNPNSPIYFLFNLAFPIVIVLPFSFSYYEDVNARNFHLIQSRIGRNNYFFSSAIVCFIGSFQVIFIPFIFNMILNFISFAQNDNTLFGVKGTGNFWVNYLNASGSADLLFSDLFLYNQDIYNLMITLIVSSFAGILGVLAYVISFHIKQYKLLIFLPIYLLFFVTDNLSFIGLRFYLLDYLLIVNYERGIHHIFFLLLIVSMLVWILISIRKKNQMEELN